MNVWFTADFIGACVIWCLIIGFIIGFFTAAILLKK